MMVCERTTTQVSKFNERWTPQTSILVDRQINLHSPRVKCSSACRILESAGYHVQACDSSNPTVGDLALARVEDVGNRNRIVGIHSQKMGVYTDDMPVGVFSNRYSTDAMQAEVANIVESDQAYDAEYKTQCLPLTLVLAPVLIVEPNQRIRGGELFWIGVGLISLVAQLFATRR